MSDRSASASVTASPSAQIGAELRARRETLGWKLPDLARSLRIREVYLEAIEAGRIGDLPGTTYALGFVRAYASALGLPGEQVASRFRAELAEAAARPALSFPVPVPRRGVPAGALMLVGLLILAGAYSGWYYVTEHQRTPAETVPPIPDHLLPRSAEKPAPSPQVASILPSASAPTPPPAPVQQTAPSTAPAPSAQVPPEFTRQSRPGTGRFPAGRHWPGTRRANRRGGAPDRATGLSRASRAGPGRRGRPTPGGAGDGQPWRCGRGGGAQHCHSCDRARVGDHSTEGRRHRRVQPADACGRQLVGAGHPDRPAAADDRECRRHADHGR